MNKLFGVWTGFLLLILITVEFRVNGSVRGFFTRWRSMTFETIPSSRNGRFEPDDLCNCDLDHWPPTLTSDLLSAGSGRRVGLPGRIALAVHVVAPVHTAAHHPRQPQGLNLLDGAGEGDESLPAPLPCPAQVACGRPGGHLLLHLHFFLFLLPPTSYVPSDQVFLALCLHMYCSDVRCSFK